MHPIVNLLLICALVHLSFSFQIPENTAPGLYAVDIDSSGREIHTPLQPLSQGSPALILSSNRPHQKRAPAQARAPTPETKTYCGDSYIEASDFLDHASIDFQWRCDRTNQEALKNKTAIYTVYGTAVVYMCNWAYESGNPCSTTEFIKAVERISQKCLWSQSNVLQVGEVMHHGWRKGYGFTSNLDKYICLPKGGRWGSGQD